MLAAISGDAWIETVFSGLAVGAKYALVALGFVVVFKATGVINFAQGGLVVVGGFLSWQLAGTWGWDFYLSIPVAMAGGALVGVVVEAVALRRLVGEQPFALIMATIGVLFVLDNVASAVWGPSERDLPDPWGTRTVDAGEVNLAVADIWTIGVVAAVVAAFFAFFRYTKLGLAMRATASDQEAALSVGISSRQVYRAAWAAAGALGALAGIMLASGAGSLGPGLGSVALAAFPAMILGGLQSPGGAVVGGVVIGLVQQLTALVVPEHLSWLGTGFERVSPYLVMVLILLVRPYGLFGRPDVRRA